MDSGQAQSKIMLSAQGARALADKILDQVNNLLGDAPPESAAVTQEHPVTAPLNEIQMELDHARKVMAEVSEKLRVIAERIW